MVDLDKYREHHAEYIKAEVLPQECYNCSSDCFDCDIAARRWQLSKKDELILQRISKCNAVRRLLRDISQIDAEIEVLNNGC